MKRNLQKKGYKDQLKRMSRSYIIKQINPEVDNNNDPTISIE